MYLLNCALYPEIAPSFTGQRSAPAWHGGKRFGGRGRGKERRDGGLRTKAEILKKRKRKEFQELRRKRSGKKTATQSRGRTRHRR